MHFTKRQLAQIEKLKRAGAIDGLRRRIQALMWEMSRKNWEEIERAGVYTGLGRALRSGRARLDEMAACLAALRALDPRQR